MHGMQTWAWWWRSRMLPEAVWNRPPLGTVNLHGSLLPQYRGAAPIHWAVLNGETTTGASTFLLKHEIDTGHVLGKVEVPIGPNDTTGAVHDRLLEAGKHLLVATVNDLADGTAQPVPQSKLLAEGERLNEAPKAVQGAWTHRLESHAQEIHNQIRGLHPFSWCMDHPSRRRHTSHSQLRPVQQDWGSPPGRPQHQDRTCRSMWGRSLQLLRVQAQGKPAMDVKDFLNGLRAPLRILGKS